ncbi:hypothetical protein JXJ21_09595 [candidate division KSB1 bacterium]|nr:hypothetical protein [candidate division KSB1 bacterium]
MTYYFKPKEAPFPDAPEYITNPGTLYRGTRFIVSGDGKLYLIMSTPTGLKFKWLDKSALTGKIPFDSLATIDIHSHPGFNFIFAILPECREFQTAAIGGFHFAYPGNDYDFSHIIKHSHILENDLSSINPQLKRAIPEHFH